MCGCRGGGAGNSGKSSSAKVAQVSNIAASAVQPSYVAVYYTGIRPGSLLYFATGTGKYQLGANPSHFKTIVPESEVSLLKVKYGKEILVLSTTVRACSISSLIAAYPELPADVLTPTYQTLGEVLADEDNARVLLGSSADETIAKIKTLTCQTS